MPRRGNRLVALYLVKHFSPCRGETGLRIAVTILRIESVVNLQLRMSFEGVPHLQVRSVFRQGARSKGQGDCQETDSSSGQ